MNRAFVLNVLAVLSTALLASAVSAAESVVVEITELRIDTNGTDGLIVVITSPHLDPSGVTCDRGNVARLEEGDGGFDHKYSALLSAYIASKPVILDVKGSCYVQGNGQTHYVIGSIKLP